MSKDGATERAAARKLLAKQLRRKAYLEAKERHAKDPRVIAMKEAAKQRRRETYQQAKEKAKVERKAVARAEKAQRSQERAAERAVADQALRSLIQKGTGASAAKEPPALVIEVEPAGGDAREGQVPFAKKSTSDPYGPN